MPAAGSAHLLAWSQRHRLRDVLRRYPIVHLRAPRLEPAELRSLAARLGRVEPERRRQLRLDGFPEILRVGNVREGPSRTPGANALRYGFHSDRSFQKHPPEFTMLHALAVPRRGGDTEFALLSRLYDAWDEETRAARRSLEVEHEALSRYFDDEPDRRSVQPLVRRHPDTGRQLVYASPAYARKVLGVAEAEGEAILRSIADALEPPDVVHRWQPNDLLVWDNRAVAHRATAFDPGEPRRLWRIAVHADA